MNQTIQQLAAPGVQALRPYTPGKPLSELEREYGIRNAVKLASNENPLGPSPRVLQALQAIDAESSRFPGLFMTGNAFRGVSLNDCVLNALHTAQSVVPDQAGDRARQP